MSRVLTVWLYCIDWYIHDLFHLIMKLNARLILAEAVSMLLTLVLTPVYFVIYVIKVTLRYLDNSQPVKAKHVLITGSTSGLGEALAHSYVKTCSTLILVGRSKEKLESVKSDCKKLNSRCNVKTIVGDMNKPEEYKHIMEVCARDELVGYDSVC